MEKNENQKTRQNYKSRKFKAKQRGLDFTLSYWEFLKLREIKTCFYTGITLRFTNHPEADSWTLDRVDNNLGYIPGNVVVCSHAANIEKAKSFDQNRFADPVLCQQISEKLMRQASVTIKKQSKLSRIWKIILE